MTTKAASKQQNFQAIIESMVLDGRTTYMEAIGEYMEKHDALPHQVKKLISPLLEDKIFVECTANNLLIKEDISTLPI